MVTRGGALAGLQVGDHFVGDAAGGSELELAQSRGLTQGTQALPDVVLILAPGGDDLPEVGALLGGDEIAGMDIALARDQYGGQLPLGNPGADGGPGELGTPSSLRDGEAFAWAGLCADLRTSDLGISRASAWR